MSERERWIVYPLLFLALGASLRDKLGGRTMSKSIVCQELRIEDEPVSGQPPRTLAYLGRAEQAGKPSIGALIVNGEVEVAGKLKVNGTVNANQYACLGHVFLPPMPAFSLPDVIRMLQASRVPGQPDSGNADQVTDPSPAGAASPEVKPSGEDGKSEKK